MRLYSMIMFTIMAASVCVAGQAEAKPIYPAPVGVTTQQVCPNLLNGPLVVGDENLQVVKLQTFLLEQGFEIPAGKTGYYGSQTKTAVSMFQSKYAFQILYPLKLTAPTGLVYNGTLAQINAIHCSK